MSLDYRPDDANAPGILATAQFLLPDKAGNYRTAYSASQINASFDNLSSMTSAALGARMVEFDDGTPAIYVGNTTELWEIAASGGLTLVSNVSRAAGGAYATGSNRWWFCPFGSSVIATNYADATQVRTGSTAGTAFTALSGAPKAKFCLSQGGFLLACNYNDGSAVPNGIKWADQGSSTSWTSATGHTAGNAILRQSSGAIIAGAEIHDIVAIWKPNSMYVGRVVGGAGTEVWRFDMISPKIGCVSQEAWASTPVGIIFVSNNGVYKFDGSVPVPIDRGIRNDIYRNFGTALSSVQVSHDEASQCIFIWSSTSGFAYAYNYASDKWGFPYLNSSLGNASYTTMTCVVRDANYPDLAVISATGTNASYNRAHLVISSEKKLCNLQNKNAGTGINASYSFLNVRDPKAGPDDLTQLIRAVPVHVFNPESGSYDSEPSSGTMTVSSKPRIGAGATSSQAVSMDAANVRYDCNITANTLGVSFSYTAQTMILADVLFNTNKVGTA